MSKQYTVRALRCDYQASDEEVYERLQAVTADLDRSWAKIESAKTVVFKVNMSKPFKQIVRFSGRRQELVDESVFRAFLKLLRSKTNARVYALDSMFERPNGRPYHALNYANMLNEYEIEFIDGHAQPLVNYDVPGGGIMFKQYQLSGIIAQADAFISVAKLKNHAFQGVTLSLKNLFGLPPMTPFGRTRTYFHHIIRLSHVLPDLGLITKPCLNIVDGLVGQAGREWGGQGRISNVLLAGDNTIATDACGMKLMGHDPNSDWPHQPFVRDRSALKIAAEQGFGTTNLDEIDFQSDVEGPIGEYMTDHLDSSETVASWRRTTCEQALHFRDNQKKFVGSFANEYIMLQNGVVIWHGPDAFDLPSRRELAGAHKESAIFLKLCDPEEREGEHFEVYEKELARMAAPVG